MLGGLEVNVYLRFDNSNFHPDSKIYIHKYMIETIFNTYLDVRVILTVLMASLLHM